MIVGLSAKMGCGKSTLADMLVKRMGGVRLPFAGVLKRECAEYFGYPDEWNYSEEGKAKLAYTTGMGISGAVLDFANEHGGGLTVRQLLQWYGTDYRRAQDPDYWLKAMDREIEKAGAELVFIDDVRFPNEAEYVTERGGLMVRLEPYPEWKPGPYAGHASETALDGYAFDVQLYPAFGELGYVARYLTGFIRARMAA